MSALEGPGLSVIEVPSNRGAMVVEVPERIPWSVLGPEFHRDWGRSDPKDPQPEHLEILGPSGSGKTFLKNTIITERVRYRGTAVVCVATKPDDKTMDMMGWPVVDTWGGVQEWRQCIFWPKTNLRGRPKKAYHARKLKDLLHRLWVPKANVLLDLDEIGYIQRLDAETAELMEEYYRECRSLGITLSSSKQRPQGAVRAMHSETVWTAAFRPQDLDDAERVAQLFGRKREWTEILGQLDPLAREFVIRSGRSGNAYISWVDTPFRPVKAIRHNSSIYGQRTQERR